MNKKLYPLIAVLVLASMLVGACTPAATATGAPAATAAPATEAPTSSAAPKILTIAYSQEPDNVVGEYSNMTYAVWLDQVVMAGLGKWDDKNN